ncbi:MAG: Ig-like domain-containing protein [Planctomycetota bacterium]|nr:Ig-like domain-containing protein [Planctomycetota bacterium]
MKRTATASSTLALPIGLSLLAFSACGGSNSAVGEAGFGFGRGDFQVVRTAPVNGATIFLNDPVSIDFSTPVDLDSATLNTMTFQALDQQGNPISELVTGIFTIGRANGDAEIGRRLQFVPRFPTNNDYTDGGFKAGRTYLVQLVGGSANNNQVLRDINGRALNQPITFQFSTREGTQPAQLFRDPKAGGPLGAGLSVTTASDLTDVPLGLFGAPPLEVRLNFDQALNPNTANVPVAFDVDPLVRDINDRGRVYLEYDDPEYGLNTWIPADVELESNNLAGATLVLRPAGVLPNNAIIRVIVEQTLEDISGENNLGNLAYNRVFGTFSTSQAYEQQWNGIAEDFATARDIDLGASFPESQAEVGPGYVRAGFAFEGNPTSLEYEPTANEVVLNTSFTQVVPKQGLPFTVAGGVFNFKNVTIPQGVTVRGSGPNPMVWLCSGKFTVAGTLTVSGGEGARVDTLNSANFAKAGGVGSCGGGNGGEGTPSATLRDIQGGTGRGPLQEAGKGGRGGNLACTTGCYTGSGYNGSGGGSGGGGGTMATQGDLNWRGTIPSGTIPNTSGNTSFQQVFGYGGAGCSGSSQSRTQYLAGGEPGDLLFTDSRQDNNFWGSAIDINRNLRITGELTSPVGGGGGGGGGDTSPSQNCTLTGGNPTNDWSGGGGGGGGGVLIVKALEEIRVTASGTIRADGGNGGGGEQVGACGEGGGGGGGAGGMVVLMSASRIVIEAHGNPQVGANGRFVYGTPTAGSTASHPYEGRDYDFAISADGGVCTTGGFGAVNVQGKYRPNGQQMIAGTSYDTEPLGGLGGMGIVQLMVPPGENLTDGTNTRLDDNVQFLNPGSLTEINGAGKRQLLAWRGFPDQTGTFVDDAGNPTNIGNNEGDIRPAPTLMPVPFNSKSRVRSKWIDTGAAQRRELTVADNQPRGLITAGGAQVGPVFEFAGLDTNSQVAGYVDYETLGSSVRIKYPIAVPAAQIVGIDTQASYLGQPAYRITVDTPSLGEDNRYVQYQAELLNSAGSILTGYRVLSHSGNELLVEASAGLVPTQATQVQVKAKFFKIVTNGSEGLGSTYQESVGNPTPIPYSNVRIGFAFHQDPDPSNILAGRYPASSEQDFVRDLNDPGLQAWIAANGAPRYVQWDVVFDMAYHPTNPALSQTLTPSTPRPQIEFLRIPFRF